MNAVALVQISSVELGKLLTVGRQALGRKLSASADQMGHNPPLHHMLCIAALKDKNAKSAGDIFTHLNLFHAGFLIGADERDAAEILELAAMPGMVVESQARGLVLMFVSGTLAQWRDAIVKSASATGDVRQIYRAIHAEFKNLGLEAAFKC